MKNLLHQLARALVFNQLKKIKTGQITIIEGSQKLSFGKKDKLNVTVTVHDPRFFGALAFGGSIGVSEAFMQKFWSVSDLTKLIRIMAINQNTMDQLEGLFDMFLKPILKCLHYLNQNSVKGSEINISKHYDLGNEFFSLFLDSTMMYSSAVFKKPHDSLYQGSIHKLETICQGLELTSQDHIIEIGSGWGGFAIYAAQHYGCKVTTTTISKEQYKYVSQKIKDLKLSHKITVLFSDYRHLKGQYDKLVSIEMLEAVGYQYYETYFKVCASLLKPQGLAVIQTITITDQRYEKAKRSVDFIQRYIFPGSCIPSITALQNSMTQSSDLKIYSIHDIGTHYARTLALWRERLFKNLKDIKALGFDDAFIRMWHFYFSYCEGGFEEKVISDIHLKLVKPGYRTKY
ncbi:MAG: cyclopropane-fatty-acyl-phospholipid synthase [Candidatus Methylopumilus sp.]|nr:cyclopropane-fatty-acyl-phospholipid synthase [Candidatus Methylopumilus sp.]